jgi:hypothetical protein
MNLKNFIEVFGVGTKMEILTEDESFTFTYFFFKNEADKYDVKCATIKNDTLTIKVIKNK